MTTAAHGGTYPAAGVTVARPATAPVSAPVMLGLPSRHHASASQVTIPAAAAVLVFTKATAATPLAASALPPLKPNQPNQSSPAPSATKGMLCDATFSPGASARLPTTKIEASAAMPALKCTTMPPAKSITPHWARKPPPQTQWTKGI